MNHRVNDFAQLVILLLAVVTLVGFTFAGAVMVGGLITWLES